MIQCQRLESPRGSHLCWMRTVILSHHHPYQITFRQYELSSFIILKNILMNRVLTLGLWGSHWLQERLSDDNKEDCHDQTWTYSMVTIITPYNMMKINLTFRMWLTLGRSRWLQTQTLSTLIPRRGTATLIMSIRQINPLLHTRSIPRSRQNYKYTTDCIVNDRLVHFIG